MTGIASPLGAPVVEDSTVKFTLASLAGVAVDQGSMAKNDFKALDSFSGETEIFLIVASTSDASTFQELKSEPNNSVVVRAGVAASAATPDLDSNGSIEFRDFVLFAQNYGKKIEDVVLPSSKAATKGAAGANPGSSLILNSERSGQSITVVAKVKDAVNVSGYHLVLSFDPSAMTLKGAEAIVDSRFGEGHSVALQTRIENGKVMISDMLSQNVSGDQELVSLRFEMSGTGADGRLEISQALVADGAGAIDQLLGAHVIDLTAMPTDYYLGQNYPNPFNPETVVPFALPEAGDVHLAVYSLLGQEIAVLAEGRRPAGFYRVKWDGKDSNGQAVGSGVYFFKFVTNGLVDTGRMLLLK